MHHPISYKFGRPGIGSSKAPNFSLSSALFRPATLGPRSEKLRFQPSRMRKWEYITIVFIAITDVILRWHRPANLWIHQLPRPWQQCKVQRTYSNHGGAKKLLAANISDMLRLQSAAPQPQQPSVNGIWSCRLTDWHNKSLPACSCRLFTSTCCIQQSKCDGPSPQRKKDGAPAVRPSQVL